LYKGDNLQTIYFTEKAREVTTFYALQMPWEVGYSAPFLIKLEHAIVTFFYVIVKERLD
jgi:hypothetical protein